MNKFNEEKVKNKLIIKIIITIKNKLSKFLYFNNFSLAIIINEQIQKLNKIKQNINKSQPKP